MSLKLISVLVIFTLAAIVLVVEARGGRGRGGSSIFYRRSYKKQSSPSGTSSSYKIVSGSPVHATYTKSLISGHIPEEKFGKYSSRRRSSHKSSGGGGGGFFGSSRKSSGGGGGGGGFFGSLFGSRKSSSSSGGSSSGSTNHYSSSGSNNHYSSSGSTNRYSSHGSNSQHSSSGSKSQHSDTHVYSPSHTNSYSQPYHHNTEHRTNSWNRHGSSPSHLSSPAINTHISHTWGGQQLMPGHVHVTHSSSIPTNAVYYAQPPQYSSTNGGSTNFALGYLIGRGSSHGHHHHHYYNQQREPQQTNAYSSNTYIEPTADTNTTPLPYVVKNNIPNQTNYWPTDYEVSLAPLNNTLLPETVTEPTQAVIFKKPPIVTAQTLSTNNLTFELPTATAAPPETPPTDGIICMPWSFNETDPTHPENVVAIEKIVCFPAPPTTTTTTTTTTEASIAGDIGVDKYTRKTESPPKDRCDDVKCGSIYDITLDTDPCCFTDKKLMGYLNIYG